MLLAVLDCGPVDDHRYRVFERHPQHFDTIHFGVGEEAMGQFMRRTMKGFILLGAVIMAGCGMWSAPQAAPGPVPLGPPGTTIARLKREKPSFETTLRRDPLE